MNEMFSTPLLVDSMECSNCGNRFTPRAGSGGKPQKFCGEECRRAFHGSKSPTPKAGVGPGDVGGTKEPPEPTPHQQRSMLIAGVEDFDQHFGNETAAEAVDSAVADGKVSLKTPPFDEPDPGEPWDWRKGRVRNNIVIPEQAAIAVYANPDDDIVIRQAGQYSDDEDQTIFVRRQNLVPLIRILERAEKGEI